MFLLCDVIGSGPQNILNDTSISESGASTCIGISNIYIKNSLFKCKYNNISNANLNSNSIHLLQNIESESSISFCSFINNKQSMHYASSYLSDDSNIRITVSSCNYVENSGGNSVVLTKDVTILFTKCNFIKSIIDFDYIQHMDGGSVTIDNCYLDKPLYYKLGTITTKNNAAREINLGLSHMTIYECIAYTPSIIKNVNPIFYNESKTKYIAGVIACQTSS